MAKFGGDEKCVLLRLLGRRCVSCGIFRCGEITFLAAVIEVWCVTDGSD